MIDYKGIWRLLWRPSGPRRDASDAMAVQLDQAQKDNTSAIRRNLVEARRLIADALRIVNNRRDIQNHDT